MLISSLKLKNISRGDKHNQFNPQPMVEDFFMPIKQIIQEDKVRFILDNSNLPNIILSEKTGVSLCVIRRLHKENGVIKNKFIPPVGVTKKEFFNFDVYSNGKIFNRNTQKETVFKATAYDKIIKGKKYFNKTSKRGTLYINHNGIRKEITISLANLVGILFIPNPNKCKYIHFKEGGKNNCDYKNLYWSDKHFRSERIKMMPQNLKKRFLAYDYEQLSRFDKPVYSWVINKDIEPLMSFFKKERRYFYAIMMDVWKRCDVGVVSISTIDDRYALFIDGITSLLDRGFYTPSAIYYKNDKRFLFYCRNHLIGSIKNYLYRQRPKQKKLDELFLPGERGKFISRQHHEFSE